LHLRSSNWSSSVFVTLALGAFLAAYLYICYFDPSLLPPSLRLGGLHSPTTILLLGTDVVYTDLGNRTKKIDQEAFTGRSDTVMVVRLDPDRNTLGILSIPRDTQVNIPGAGLQKVNAANALGGHNLAVATVSNFLGLPIEHYVVLNVHGLVELVNELGGITVEIPKRMRYLDWTAKLKIDLEPGLHTLTGNQAMGFVRFRHDALGDIGRVQRQEIFLRAVMDKARQPESWSHIPRLIEIASRYIDTDLSVSNMVAMASFVKGVPKKNQSMMLMPGFFTGTGDWGVTKSDVRRMVARLLGTQFVYSDRKAIRLSIENDSSDAGLSMIIARLLRKKGYPVTIKRPEAQHIERKYTKFIAMRGNSEDAEEVKLDLGGQGEVVTESVGDIESAVSIKLGDDLLTTSN
jgi:LCP family protein required for cell wall assembly